MLPDISIEQKPIVVTPTPSETTSNPSDRIEQKPIRSTSAAQIAANRRNALCDNSGRKRKRMNWDEVRRRRMNGEPLKAIAQSQSMSYWTLKRRLAERGEDDAPIW